MKMKKEKDLKPDTITSSKPITRFPMEAITPVFRILPCPESSVPPHRDVANQKIFYGVMIRFLLTQ